jgi:flagellar protein FliO/FliZ
MSGLGVQSFMAVAVVLALVGGLAWAARRGSLSSLSRRGPIVVETAVPLGERRSLVIVSIEGRRLLLGLTPAQVSLVTELRPGATFEQEVSARA